MDVRCAKCGIEYEFDDAKVTAAGVTVKCTNCGHVFKVKREEAGTVPPSPSTSFGQVMPVPGGAAAGFNPNSTFAKGMDGGEWMVKRVDGQVFRFKELTTLQKWIVERKVGRDDEISKTGKTWKKLGEIAELASFFQVVDAANAALQASVPIGINPAMPAGNAVHGFVVVPNSNAGMPTSTPGVRVPEHLRSLAPGVGPASSLPPMTTTPQMPGDIHSATTQTHNVAGQPPAAPLTSAPSQPPVMMSSAQPTPQPVTPAVRGADGFAAAAAAGMPSTGMPPKPPAAPTVVVRDRERNRAQTDVDMAELDDDDPVLQMIKRRRRNVAALITVVVLVVVGAGALMFWPQIQTALGLQKPASLTSAQVDGAKKALSADRLDGLAAARAELAKAPPSPTTTAWITLLDIGTASHENEQARIEEQIPERAAHAKQMREAAAATLASAYAAINKVRDTPGLVEGHLASAAYNLEKGGLAEQRADLESARAVAKAAAGSGTVDPAVDAEIAVQAALADARAGLVAGGDPKDALSKVVGSDGRLAYAKAALAVQVAAKSKAAPDKAPADVDVAAAKAAIAAVAAPDERATLLSALLESLVPKVAPPPVVVDAGVAAATADAGTAAATPPPGADLTSYDGIMRAAEKARVNDKSRVAHELFQKAAKLKPGVARPWIGLGWTALNISANAEAVRDFQKALSIDENIGEAQFGLAEAYRYTGDKQHAIEAYQTYLKMEPAGKDAGTAKRAIEALK